MTEKELTTSGINSWRFPNTTGHVLPCLLPLRVSFCPRGGERRKVERCSNPEVTGIGMSFGKSTVISPFSRAFETCPDLSKYEMTQWVFPEEFGDTPKNWGISLLSSLSSFPQLLSPTFWLVFPLCLPFPFLLIPSSPPLLSFFLQSPLIPSLVSSVLTSWILLCSSFRGLHPTKDHLAPVLSLHPTTPVLWGHLCNDLRTHE